MRHELISPRAAPMCIILFMTLTGCRTEIVEPEAPPSPPVESTVQRGPVQVTSRADHETILVGEKLAFTIDVRCEPGVDISMPMFEETIGGFEIEEALLPPDIPDGQRRRWTHVYTLTTYDHGRVELPALTVPFMDRRDPDEPIEGEIITDPLTVTVRTVLAGAVEEEPLHDIKDVIDVPVRRVESWVWGVVTLFAILVTLMFAMLWIRRRRAAEEGEGHIPPHIWAMLQLEQLEVDRLVEKHEIHAFYFRLSDIIRQYIERRFRIMAPDRTTDEFLREMKRFDPLTIGHKELLSNFLRAADMVKFALHEPESADCQEAFASASTFVMETTPSPEEEDEEEEEKASDTNREEAA